MDFLKEHKNILIGIATLSAIVYVYTSFKKKNEVTTISNGLVQGTDAYKS